MTREERHITVLNRMLESMDVYDSIQPTTERKKAIKAAIQALSQEPTEKPMTVDEMEREYEKSKALFHKIVEGEDAISRQAVLSKIKEVCFSEEWTQFRLDNGSNGQRDFLINYIEQLPSITQKSKTGHWIDDADEIDAQYGRHMYRCQICDEYADYFVEGTDDWWHIKKPNFCSSCGAKMESEDKE